MLTAVATVTDIGLRGLRLRRGRGGRGAENEPARPTSTRSPRAEEMLWGFGSFVVFAVLLRYYLYPRLRKGWMRSLRAHPVGPRAGRADHRRRRDDVSRYETQLAAIGPRRSSASSCPDDARRRSAPSA